MRAVAAGAAGVTVSAGGLHRAPDAGCGAGRLRYIATAPAAGAAGPQLPRGAPDSAVQVKL